MKLTWSSDQYDEKKMPAVSVEEFDEETGEPVPSERPTHLINTILVSLTIILIEVMLGGKC